MIHSTRSEGILQGISILVDPHDAAGCTFESRHDTDPSVSKNSVV
jgi:hypothetical protein